MADAPETDPDDRDPRERDLSRRSEGGSVTLWLIIGLIALLGVGVYVASAML